MGQHKGLTVACCHRCGIEEVAAARVPAVSVDLMQTVIVVGRGIETIDKGGGVDGGEGGVALRQEIIAIIGIRIARAARRVVAAPADGTFGIEQAVPVDVTGGHLMQVVGRCQRVAIEHLILQVAAIAIDMHTAQIAEACLPDQAPCQLIHPRGGHPDLRPRTCSQDRVSGVSFAFRSEGRSHFSLPGNTPGARLNLQHEADKDLILAVAAH